MSKQIRILAVDDDPHFCELLRDVFDGIADCELTVVTDGDAAELRLQNEPFDAVLLDLAMPGKDGWSVLKYIRITQPDLPVLLLSGLEKADPAVLGDVCTEFAEKPAKLSGLAELLAHYVARFRKPPEPE